MTRVLVVDDEPMVRDVIAAYLVREGIECETAADGSAGLEVALRVPPDLVVLDIQLPRLGGLEVLSRLRAAGGVPVILLTASGEEDDRVIGLDLGADDYVVKPFSPRELMARIRSVLRRTSPDGLIERAGLTIDTAQRSVFVDGDAVGLTRREFDLLAFLASSPGQVFSRTQLLHHVWGSTPEWQDPATVTVHVRRVRTKLDAAPSRFIETVRGVGYRCR